MVLREICWARWNRATNVEEEFVSSDEAIGVRPFMLLKK